MAIYKTAVLLFLATFTVCVSAPAPSVKADKQNAPPGPFLWALLEDMKTAADDLENAAKSVVSKAGIRYNATVSDSTRAGMVSCALEQLGNATVVAERIYNISHQVRGMVQKLSDGFPTCDGNIIANTMCKIRLIRDVWNELRRLRKEAIRLLNELHAIADSFSSCLQAGDQTEVSSSTPSSTVVDETTIPADEISTEEQPTDVQPTDAQPTDVQPTDVQPTNVAESVSLELDSSRSEHATDELEMAILSLRKALRGFSVLRLSL